MTTRESDDLPRATRLLTEIAGAVTAARSLLAEGAIPDLTGLDLRVGDLCGLLGTLPPDDARAHLDALLRLSEALAALEAECARGCRDAAPVQTASTRARAVLAYARPTGKG